MIVVYLHQFFFPSERAHTVQMLHTGVGLAERGIETHLFAKPNPELRVDSIAAGLARYGLKAPPALHIHLSPSSGRSHASLWSRWHWLRTLVRHHRAGDAAELIVFVRKFRTVRELVRFRRLTRTHFRIVIEVHDIPSLLERPYDEVAALAVGTGPLGDLAEARDLAGADGAIAITDACRDLLARALPAGFPLATIRSGAALATVPALDAGTKTAPLVLYAGQLLAWKGVETLIAAMGKVPAGAMLEVVGGDPAGSRVAELAALARAAGVADRVRCRGLVPHGEIAALYGRADCLVLPNRRTVIGGFFSSPIKLFEYMASGVPIVAADLPAIREVLRHRENALLVEPESPPALAAGIATVLGDRPLRAALAAQARADVAAYTWERRTDRLLAFFRDAAAG
jgi:glycosyltransferase involved in cell wall biosynthesis